MQRRDAEALQPLRLADAGQLQDVRRLHRAGGQDHLAPTTGFVRLAVLRVGHADRALALEDHPRCQRFRLHAQIAPRPRGIEEGARRRPAPPILLRHLVVAEAFLPAVVVVGVLRKTLGRRGVDHRVEDLVPFDHVGNVQWSAASARVVAAAFEMFRFLEIRQHRVIRPAAIAELRPGVVVERVAAHVQHAVDRAGTAERLAARDRDGTASHAVLRLGVEAPVVAGVVQQLAEADGDVDPEVGVLRPGFEQQNVGAWVLA